MHYVRLKRKHLKSRLVRLFSESLPKLRLLYASVMLLIFDLNILSFFILLLNINYVLGNSLKSESG